MRNRKTMYSLSDQGWLTNITQHGSEWSYRSNSWRLWGRHNVTKSLLHFEAAVIKTRESSATLASMTKWLSMIPKTSKNEISLSKAARLSLKMTRNLHKQVDLSNDKKFQGEYIIREELVGQQEGKSHAKLSLLIV